MGERLTKLSDPSLFFSLASMHDIVICGKAADSGFFEGVIDQLQPKVALHLPEALRLERVTASEEVLEHIAQIAHAAFCDFFVLPAGLCLQDIRLFCFDMDSTLIENECINDMAAEAGVLDEMKELSRRAMAGEIGFLESLQKRVALLAGHPASIIDHSTRCVRLYPGSRQVADFARKHGIPFYIISGGFIDVARAVGNLIGASGVISNELVVKDGRLTGEVTGPAGNEIIDVFGKRRIAQVLAQLNRATLKETLCCGDGANDLEMVRCAGIGVACHAKPVLDVATKLRIHHTGIESLTLFFRESWDEANVLEVR